MSVFSLNLCLLVLALSQSASGEEVLGRLYFTEFMGHLHKEPVDSSASLTALQCAHSVSLVEKKGVHIPSGWKLAKIGEDTGFIRTRFLSDKRPDCFQEKYPKFYNKLNFDLADLYYWGRLPDHFLQGESLPE